MPFSLPSVISMRAFQIRLLNWILLANVGFSLVLLLLGLTPLIVPPPYWSQVLMGGILLMLALWAIVRTAPQHYAAVSIVMTVAALVLFTYALTKSQANELRALWFLTGGRHRLHPVGQASGYCLHVCQSGTGAGYQQHPTPPLHAARADRFHAGNPVVQHVLLHLRFARLAPVQAPVQARAAVPAAH